MHCPKYHKRQKFHIKAEIKLCLEKKKVNNWRHLLAFFISYKSSWFRRGVNLCEHKKLKSWKFEMKCADSHERSACATLREAMLFVTEMEERSAFLPSLHHHSTQLCSRKRCKHWRNEYLKLLYEFQTLTGQVVN